MNLKARAETLHARTLRSHASGFKDLLHTVFVAGGAWTGDVFERALVVDTLIDARDAFGLEATDLISAELRYLIGMRRRDPIGAWSYLPDYQSLSADADTLAEMIRVFTRPERIAQRDAYCAAALRVLFKDCCYENGSFETYIIRIRPGPVFSTCRLCT